MSPRALTWLLLGLMPLLAPPVRGTYRVVGASPDTLLLRRDPTAPVQRVPVATIQRLLGNHVRFTGSTVAKAVLDDFEKELRWFVKVMPTDYRRVLEHKAEIEERARQLSAR